VAGPAAVDVLAAIEASLAAGGFNMTRDSVGGRQAVIGRTSAFRLRWMATKLHTFVLAAVFEGATARPDKLDRFLEESSDYARTMKGGLPRGLQTGTAAVVVAVAESAGEAGDWAVKPHGRKFAALTYPVLVDVARRTVTSPARMVIGAVYVPWFRQVVADHVAPAVAAAGGN
jgi:hypothetical protein